MQTEDSETLRPTLERAKRTLRSALGEACKADLERADTGELIRIEEVLAIANEAAKEAISVRRRLRSRPGRPAATPTADESPASAEQSATSSREIEDSRGVRWVVFAVHPSTRAGRPVVSDHFRDGWLSFDCGAETRRLAPIRSEWSTFSDEQLRELCDQAEASPRRTRKGDKGAR